MTDGKKRLVLLNSGGPDALLAGSILSENYSVHSLFVDYDQHSAARERLCAQLCAEYLDASHSELTLDVYRAHASAIGMISGKGRSSSLNPISEYVPFRNTLLLANAVALAESLQASAVGIGSIAGPWVTPDNRPEYFEALRELVNAGTLKTTSIDVETPLQELSKTRVIDKCLDRELPLQFTWSCHNSNTTPCQSCGNCDMRSTAFRELQRSDPLMGDWPNGTAANGAAAAAYGAGKGS
ncbi:7-cyano-7-deazaguanine synthase [Streptomyces sp. NPDC059679]|uniref:7-cyano-7-deazaguanine synthase n=1 Tax=Streptomyces sp. NPDC059679 TaxID=3346903 RepID=UPI0036B35788